MSKAYDLIALGGGSAGLAAAQRAAEYGTRALVIERGPLGGTCVNVGCVPKKVMWHAAELAQAFSEASNYGFEAVAPSHDWAALVARREAYVQRLNGIYARNLDEKSVDWVSGSAKFIDVHTLEVNGEQYTAPHIIIATGGEPIVPAVPGADFGITSDGFFKLTAMPKRVAVVGSGYIAIELAGILGSMGSDVELFARYGSVLRSMDEMLQAGALKSLEEHDIGVRLSTPVAAIMKADNSLTLTLKDGLTAGPFDALIWAVGRRPLTDGIGLEQTGVELDDRGYVVVDKFQQSNVAGVYAIGDVTGQVQLTPVAIAAGRRLSDRVFGGMEGRHLDYTNVPTVIFSHPPIGSIGLTETAAREQYGDDVKVYTSSFIPLYYGICDHKIRAAMKLITVGAEERVVGCHMIGAGSDEILQGFAVAVKMGACKQDLDDTVAIHPTCAEELVTMR